MKKKKTQSDSNGQQTAGGAFARRLKAEYSPTNPVPPEIDMKILAKANEVLALESLRRRRRWGLWCGSSVAAAIVLVAVMLNFQPANEPQTASMAVSAITGDIDHSGSVDILDAWRLAKSIEDSAVTGSDRDITGDGKVDKLDVDAIANIAVRL